MATAIWTELKGYSPKEEVTSNIVLGNTEVEYLASVFMNTNAPL